jgi:OOP family OmpA-OmpF porin
VAVAATAYFERDRTRRVAEALDAAGLDWVEVASDGLTVALAGAAPDEPGRFRAVEIAKRVVPAGRVEDATTVREPEPLGPPPFALEVLRNEAEVSLIGIVPEPGGRADIRAALEAAGLAADVIDMLETTEHAAPAGWRPSLELGLRVVAELPRARVSVAPGAVGVIAVADSDASRAELTARLQQATPAGVALELDITAPRPVIAPFRVDFSLEGGVGSFAACSAGSDEDAAAILAAAREAGLAGDAACAVGLGAPSRNWAAAVARGFAALLELGGGRFAIRDLEALLTGPPDIAPERLSAVGKRLDAALPAVFALTTIAPPRMEARDGGPPVYAPRFDAVLQPDGTLRLEGPMHDAASQEAIHSFARALFGSDRVENATVIDPALPEGWPLRVLSGIEALAETKEGSLVVTPDAVAVEGSSIEPDAESRVAAMLTEKLGDAVEVAVAYDAAAAAAAAAAARSRPEICAEEIAAILADGSIQFAAGSATIDPASGGVIAAIADVLHGCPGARFEIGGHTDSQGRQEVNQRLSEERAEAVVAALKAEAPPLISLSARGFGATRPVADNDSEEGRARNRRIEMTLVVPGPRASAAEARVGPQ